MIECRQQNRIDDIGEGDGYGRKQPRRLRLFRNRLTSEVTTNSARLAENNY